MVEVNVMMDAGMGSLVSDAVVLNVIMGLGWSGHACASTLFHCKGQ